ncbi:MAG: hypothetical protein JXA30_13985 [Deltaproteobacteria bacterium]|nr:hypothetical protein [Deltaproteobacteria bacterium]
MALDVDTSFQAYEVRSPAAGVFWARRRLVDSLALRFIQPLEERKNPALGPKLEAQLQLRLFQDFGDTCFVSEDLCVDATEVEQRGVYQPLARNSLIDAPTAYLEVSRLFEKLRVRLGRQLYWDRTGFARVDGIRVQSETWRWLTIDTLGGVLVRDTSVAGSSAFVPQGIPRLRLNSEQQSRAPFVEKPTTTYFIGANLDAGEIRILRAGVAYRSLLENDGSATRLVGAGAVSQVFDPVLLDVNAVMDLFDAALVESRASSQLELDATTWALSLQRHVPRFDWATIWAYFASAPVWEESFSLSWRATSKIEVGGSLGSRHARIDDQTDHDMGLDGHVSVGIGGYRFDLSAFGWTGSLGPVWGGDLSGERRLLSWLNIEALLSLWSVEQSLRSEIQGISISETLSAKFRVTENTSFLSELTHAHSDEIGHRFSFYAFLHMEVWR